MDTSQRGSCAVCGKPTNDFNYGAQTCNACKQFFRRVELFKTPIEVCNNGGNCYPHNSSRCRFCRLQLCMQAGMIIPSPANPAQVIHHQFVSIIEGLKSLDLKRIDMFQNYIADEGVGLDEIISADRLRLERRPEDHPRGFNNWSIINHVTTINFIKELDVMNHLPSADSTLLIKSTYIKFLVAVNAMRAHTSGQHDTSYPGGFDIFSEEIQIFYADCPRVLDKVRCQLVARLADLNVTQEEFLLMSAIFICNPIIASFSKATQTIIAHHQKTYNDTLFQLCLHTHQTSGASRFVDLLFVCQAVDKSYRDFRDVIIGFRASEQDVKILRLFHDGISQMIK